MPSGKGSALALPTISRGEMFLNTYVHTLSKFRVIKHGVFPIAMLYHKGHHRREGLFWLHRRRRKRTASKADSPKYTAYALTKNAHKYLYPQFMPQQACS